MSVTLPTCRGGDVRGVVKRNVVGFDQTGYWSGRETRYLVLTPSLLLIYYSEVESRPWRFAAVRSVSVSVHLDDTTCAFEVDFDWEAQPIALRFHCLALEALRQWVDAFIAVGLSFDARTLARLQAHSDIIRRAPRQRISVMLTVEDGIDVDHDSAADATLNSALHAKISALEAALAEATSTAAPQSTVDMHTHAQRLELDLQRVMEDLHRAEALLEQTRVEHQRVLEEAVAAALSNAKLTEAESQRVVAVAEADALRETLDSVRIESAQRIEQLELQLSEAVSTLHLLEAAVEMDVALDASAPPTAIPVSPPLPAPTPASSTASPSSRSPALPPALRSPASDRRSVAKSVKFADEPVPGNPVAGAGKASIPGAGSPAVSPSAPPVVSPKLSDDPEWSSVLQSAEALRDEGRLEGAEALARRALQLCRHRGKPTTGVQEVEEEAQVIRTLVGITAQLGRLAVAEGLQRTLVDLISESHGEAHPFTAYALTDLVALLRQQEKLEDAFVVADRVIESLKLGVGPMDIGTATAQYNKAGIAKEMGRDEDALSGFTSALTVFELKAPNTNEHGDTAYQVAQLCRRRKDYASAAKRFLEAGAIYTALYGADDKRAVEAAKRAKQCSGRK